MADFQGPFEMTIVNTLLYTISYGLNRISIIVVNFQTFTVHLNNRIHAISYYVTFYR